MLSVLFSGAAQMVSPEYLAAFHGAEREISYLTVSVAQETGMDMVSAKAVAQFAAGRWSEAYPEPAHSLGRDGALFLARWCLARNVEPTDGNLHAALTEWRAHEAHASLGL